MPSNEILAERRGATLVVTLNRPERANALTLDMANQLFTTIKSATTDRTVRCLVLAGAGGNFMDGVDMKLYEGDFGVAQELANKMMQPILAIVRELRTMEKPVISAVSGRVTGVGFSFMLASDFVVASDQTSFQTDFCSKGSTPIAGCSYFLPRKIGATLAAEILMEDALFDAARAAEIHLVNRVVAGEQLMETALNWADKLAEAPTRAIGATKRLIMQGFEQDLNQQLAQEHGCLGLSTRSFDFREAIRAFFANRPAKFTGT